MTEARHPLDKERIEFRYTSDELPRPLEKHEKHAKHDKKLRGAFIDWYKRRTLENIREVGALPPEKEQPEKSDAKK